MKDFKQQMDSEKLIYRSWSCRFCHEAFEFSIPAERHASACTHNPDNRTCDTCAHQIFTCTVNSDGDPVTQCRVKPYLNDVYRADCEQWELKIHPWAPRSALSRRSENSGRIGGVRMGTERQQCLAAVEEEPEFPGEMPDEMWEVISKDRKAAENAFRIAVRQTKDGILERIKGLEVW